MKFVNIKDLEIVSIEDFENEFQLKDIESGVYRVSFDKIEKEEVRNGVFSVEDSEDFDEKYPWLDNQLNKKNAKTKEEK